MQRQFIAAIALSITSTLAGCATTATRDEHAHATQAANPEFASTEPIASESASLKVTGLSCPQCATNLSLNLEELPGIADARINLGTGDVSLDFGITSPSPKQLADAVADSGFTLIAINTN